MSKFIDELVRLSNANSTEKVEHFRVKTIPSVLDTAPFDEVGELMRGDKWLKEFVSPQVDSSKEERKRYTERISNKRRAFKKILSRNLARGIYGDNFVEKLSNLERRVVSGELKASENLEYYEALLNREEAVRLMNAKGERVAGENNPGHGHGGKLSPFSESFSGYDGLSVEEKRKEIDSLIERRSSTVAENPQNNPKRPEYYIEKYDVSLDTAKEMVSDHQRNFTLDICIEKYGREIGQKRFDDRQTKWQNTLGDSPIDVRYDIARKKASSGTNTLEGDHEVIWNIYIMNLTGGYTKIGHTGNIHRRISTIVNESGEGVLSTRYFECPFDIAYQVEDFIVTSLKDYSIFMSGSRINGVESTEYFHTSVEFETDLITTLRQIGIEELMEHQYE